MPFFYLLILALVQGITEFLPISSSGHLMLVHEIFYDDKADAVSNLWEKHLVMDVAVHVGTLFSVLVYFRKDVAVMFSGLWDGMRGDTQSDGFKLDLYVIVASIPVIAAGLALHKLKPDWLLAVEIVAWTTLIFGILLWWVDSKPVHKTIKDMNFKDSLLIGFAQSLALVPGTSRSGITMTMSRFLGYSRAESAHFSLLLAIVAIGGAGSLGALELIQSENQSIGVDALLAAVIAFISGLIAISLMMKWLERSTFLPFVVYRIALGLILLVVVYYDWVRAWI